MEGAFYMILSVALLAHAAYGQCPKQNERSSDSYPEMLDIKVEGSKSANFKKDSDILRGIKDDGSIRNSPGIFLTSNDEITIKSTFEDGILMTVREFSVELFKANETTLKMFSGALAKYDETEDVDKNVFDKIDFDLGKGILGVDRLVLSFIAPEGEVKVKNIFMKVCIETGWCDWQKWGACSKSCGGGVQGRKRTCSCPNPDPKVFVCPTDGPTDQTQECNPDCCPQPPTWGSWAIWAACSVTCGGGSRSRSRKCIDDKCPDKTLDCVGKKTNTEDCNKKCCPKPPSWGTWSKWGDCSVTCAQGTQERSRKCIDDPCPDKTKCPGAKTMTQVCKQPCCPQPPTWTKWGEWGACSVTCGGGTMKRRRQCNQDECHDETDCDGKDTESSKCNENCCPVPFKWAKWNKWSPCSVTCGDGSMSRSRKCRKSKCPGDYTDCEGPNKQTDECSLPCCEEIINFKKQRGVKIYVRNKESQAYLKVLQGSGKAIFLVENSVEKQYIQVELAKQYTVLELGVTTKLASYVKVSSEPEGWPEADNRSTVPKRKIRARKWNTHKFNVRPGVGPIKLIRLDFGFPSGEINVKNLFLIVCPV